MPRVAITEGLAEMMAMAMGEAYELPTLRKTTARVAQAYDRRNEFHLLDDYYDHSDYLNFGYWKPDTKTQQEACDKQMEELVALISKKEGTILDVACGKGATTRYLLDFYPAKNVTGINIAKTHLEVCRKNAPGATFTLMDAAYLEFKDETFDNVICVEAASHFDTREKFFREALRVLKPGGRLVLSDTIFTPRAEDAQVRAQQDANYVRGAQEYEQALLQSGFAQAKFTDVTDQCWSGFTTHIEKYLEDGLRSGKLAQQQYNAIYRWYNRVAEFFERYLLGYGQKK